MTLKQQVETGMARRERERRERAAENERREFQYRAMALRPAGIRAHQGGAPNAGRDIAGITAALFILLGLLTLALKLAWG